MSYKQRPIGSIFDALDESIAEIGHSQGSPGNGAQLAGDFLGKTKWTVQHECDPEDKKHRMSVRTLGLLAQRFKLKALAHYFASVAGGIFMSLDSSSADPRWSELTGQTAEDMGRFMAELVRDLADGKLDKVEAGRCLKLHTEFLRHQGEIHARLRAVVLGTGE